MQYGKVEICGVNTSQLKLLKESEKRELLNIIKNGSPAEKKKARDKMINGNLRLAVRNSKIYKQGRKSRRFVSGGCNRAYQGD